MCMLCAHASDKGDKKKTTKKQTLEHDCGDACW